MKFVRKKSQCKTCSLEGTCNKAHGQHPAKTAVAVVGEWPNGNDADEGMFFASSYGKMLLAMLSEAGCNPRNTWITGLMNCYPPDRDSQVEGMHHCEPGLREELAAMKAAGVKVIIAIGKEVLKYFGIEGDVLKVRGSVYNYDGFYIVPTYEPLYIARGNQHQVPIWVADIEKAVRISADGWKPPKEIFNIYPSIEDVEKYAEILCKTPDKIVACDLETTSLNPAHAKILVAGFAIDKERAFSIPFTKKGGAAYWATPMEQQRAFEAMKKIVNNCTLLLHNAPYDLAVLKNQGIEAGKLPHDTMLMHHAFHPELPHGLGFVGSIYADTPYWKDAVLGNAHKMIDLEDELLRTYNLRDCVVLHQIMPGLMDDLKQSGTDHIYNTISRELIGVVIDLQYNGMRLLESRLPKWKEEVIHERDNALKQLQSIDGISPMFKPGSPHHLRYLLFGTVPSSYEKASEELDAYDKPGCKRKRNTAVYVDLCERVLGIRETTPLPRLRDFTYLHTDKGAMGVGKQALTKMKMGALAELERIASYRRRPPDIEERLAGVQRMAAVLDALQKYQLWAKLASTYLTFPTGDDGRVHPAYKIHGTTTGRLASEGPNWQNLPKNVKKLFGPKRGMAFVQADFSNVEMRVQSFETGDTVLQEVFASGKKVHDENVKVMFGITPDDPMFDICKRAAKTYIFGRGYGGGLRGIYERVTMQVPELQLSYDKFEQCDAEYRAAHPAYVEWHDRIIASALKDRCVRTAFGRIRYFLGDDGSVRRQALNTPIQGAAADVFNLAIIALRKWLRQSRLGILVGAVHDSIIVECKHEHIEVVAKKMKECMEQTHHLWGMDVSFPVDIEVALDNWGEVIKLKEYLNGDHNNDHKDQGSDQDAGDDGSWDDWGEDDEGSESSIA